jgi:heme/copper-type cytochrome/quinol oxidase subunit 2
MELFTSVVLALTAIALGVVLLLFAFKGRQSKARRNNNWRRNS